MHEFLSSNQDITSNRYNRLMAIACLDTIFNLPVIISVIVTSVLQGKESVASYDSWKHVHGIGTLPGFSNANVSLSSILQTPDSEWSTGGWEAVLNVKWNEWIYVLHAVVFFSVFGTTPEMRQYYRAAFWFVPEGLGYKKQRVSEAETLSDIAFNSIAVQQGGDVNG